MDEKDLKRAILECLAPKGVSKVISIIPQSGGCINQGYKLETDQGPFFVKCHAGKALDMFQCEERGLNSLAKYPYLKVPTPITTQATSSGAFAIFEWLDLQPLTHQKEFGHQLALLHLNATHHAFGFEQDNYLGSTPQINTFNKSWPDFFAQYRLKPLLEKINDLSLNKLAEKLYPILETFFLDKITPSLLHGDLWVGNAGQLNDGQVVMFDPACYYGHHEAELSIMKMFGGFSKDCFDAYHALIPKAQGFDARQKLYQLYHYLNHYHLFGTSYKANCVSLFKDLLHH